MKKIIGKIRFGGNELAFSFGNGKMDVDVETMRDFTAKEQETVNEVIGDIARICAKLTNRIHYESETTKAFAWLPKLFPTKKVLQKEEHRTLNTLSANFGSGAKRIPDTEHSDRFYIELGGMRLIEENGIIVGWYVP